MQVRPFRTVVLLAVSLIMALAAPGSQLAPQPLAAAGTSVSNGAISHGVSASTEPLIRAVGDAPILATGAVAGERTEFVIQLAVSPDPNVPGFALPAGKRIRVTLPPAFVNTQELPLAGVTSREDCVPGNFQCVTAALIQGWPQRPVPFNRYALSYDGPNTMVITAKEDLIPQAPDAPGIKQIHMMWFSTINPEAGLYPILVEIEGASDGEWRSGYGLLEIRPKVRPTVAVTSVFNPGNPNTVYQRARPGAPVPLPYDLLLWDQDAGPMTGVTLTALGNDRWIMLQNGLAVGMAMIEAPPGATGQRLIPAGASTAMKAPISGAATARLRTYFQTGSLPGEYVVRFHLRGGNEVRMVVIAEHPGALSTPMTRIPIDMVMPGGNSVAANCQEADQEYPYQPYDWPDAQAQLTLIQEGGGSTVRIEMTDARPNTYYTVWLRLRGADADGNQYGGSPLTGIAGSPLIPSSALGEALARTGPGNGASDLLNGFFTDEMGNGVFQITLDFPIINGAYPFHRFEGFDPSDERFPAENPMIHPVAIVGPGGPFTLRLASHCADNMGHGLLPGPHEGWFDWSFE